MDAVGLTIAASNADSRVSFIGKNYGFRPYFTKAMAGNAASYFAVGATTGIPGYFVSEPIEHNGLVLGVIAVKLEPQKLPVSWEIDDNIALVTDDLGVVILSTEDDLLYTRTANLDKAAVTLIEEERRYPVKTAQYLDTQNSKRWRHMSISNQSLATFRVSSGNIGVEPWSLSLLTPVKTIHARVFRNVVVMAGVFLLAGLIWHAYRQQVKIAQERAKLTERLEQLVDEKTRELEGTHQALVAESNFSMLGRMSAAINHEINQPLASLRLNLASLRQLIETNSPDGSAAYAMESRTGKNEDSIQSTVVDLDRTAKRITRVIETLRALPQQNKTGFIPIEVPVMLHDSISIIQTDRKMLSQYLRITVSDHITNQVYVLGQRVLLQQALLNVLYNAFDAISTIASPYVELKALTVNGNLVIEVRDNGAGVSPGMEQALFEPFESAPEKISGMGIGLTLARQILTDHGGSLTYHRLDPTGTDGSRGITVFSITLPIADAPNGSTGKSNS